MDGLQVATQEYRGNFPRQRQDKRLHHPETTALCSRASGKASILRAFSDNRDDKCRLHRLFAAFERILLLPNLLVHTVCSTCLHVARVTRLVIPVTE